MLRAAALAASVAVCAAHAGLMIPGPRNADDRLLPEFGYATECNCGNGLYKVRPPPGGKIVKGACDQGTRATGGGQSCWWWSQGCSIGCERCATELIGPDGGAGGNTPHSDKIGFRKRFCNASWNSAGAPKPMINSTLPRDAWTMNVEAIEGAEEDSYRFNPWRAPGYAPVVDACGMAGGKLPHQAIGGASNFKTTSLASMGDLGSKVLKPSANRTVWRAGTVK